MDREPIPTFADNKDRLVYLLHSYRVLISLGLLVSLGLLIYFKPKIPVSPTVTAALGAFVLVGIGAIPAGWYVARWLRRYRAVTVFHVNAVDDIIQKHYVPPAVWDDKTVKTYQPWPVNDGDAWAVREYEWMDATETLVVEGCYLSKSAADDVLMTDKSHMEDIHSHLLEAYRVLGQMRGRISRMGMDVERQVFNAIHEAQEAGTTLERDGIKQVWDEVTEDFDDAMPDDDLPEPEDDLPGWDGDIDDVEHDQVTPTDPERRN